jgi:hypothetical protein
VGHDTPVSDQVSDNGTEHSTRGTSQTVRGRAGFGVRSRGTCRDLHLPMQRRSLPSVGTLVHPPARGADSPTTPRRAPRQREITPIGGTSATSQIQHDCSCAPATTSPADRYSSGVQQQECCSTRPGSYRPPMTADAQARSAEASARSSGRRGRRFKSSHPDCCHPDCGICRFRSLRKS